MSDPEYIKWLEIENKKLNLEILKLKKRAEDFKCCGNCVYHGDVCYQPISKHYVKKTNENDVCKDWGSDELSQKERTR